MHADITQRLPQVKELCRRFGVMRLEIFGSAARGVDYDTARSDADFLVEFKPESGLSALQQFFGFADALEQLLGRPVDLVERKALEQSRNYIRRYSILRDATVLYG